MMTCKIFMVFILFSNASLVIMTAVFILNLRKFKVCYVIQWFLGWVAILIACTSIVNQRVLHWSHKWNVS